MTTVERTFVSSVGAGAPRAGAGGHPCQGIWYRRRGGPAPRTAVVAAHYDIDFSEHYLAEPLAERGLGFLGWNTRFRGLGAYFQLAPALADIGVAVRWLREVAGVTTVVILGNSGGASLMGAYQAHAVDAGVLLPADLFVSLCAHPGRPDILTEWTDPSVTDEDDPLSIDADLDLFDAEHGPPFDAAFLSRYRDAQVARNHRVTAWARDELARLAMAGATDRLFCFPRAWADPRFVDLSLDPSERAAGCYFGDPRTANYGPFNLAATTTLRSWLATWSLAESHCRAERHLPRITQPALVIQATGDQGCFPSHARALFDLLGSPDKRLDWVPGDHYLQQPDGARAQVADRLAAWVAERS